MDTTEVFETLRPRLLGVAYRILGSVADAEDVLQEAWMRWSCTDASTVANPEAYLVTVVGRRATDHLRAAKRRRESYTGPWLPEPVGNEPDPALDPAAAAELADSLSMAALLLLERLSPEQRAVFVLHDVFSFPFSEIAEVIGKSETACRKLASRARRLMNDGRPRFDVDRRERDDLANRFFDAVTKGDLAELRKLLASDVEVYGDGGGKAPQWMRVVVGLDKVGRMFAALGRRFAGAGLQVERHEVNGQPGAVFRDPSGRVINARLPNNG